MATRLSHAPYWVFLLLTIAVGTGVDSAFAASDSIPQQIAALGERVTALERAKTALTAQIGTLQRELAGVQEANAALVTQLAILERAKTALARRVSALEDGLVDLQETDTALQALREQLACIAPSSNASDLYFVGCNVHVRNGAGTSDLANSLGNLVLGYNEEDGWCPNAPGVDQATCASGGGTWSVDARGGSHNLIVGPGHTYESYGGLAVGRNQALTAPYAVASEVTTPPSTTPPPSVGATAAGCGQWSGFWRWYPAPVPPFVAQKGWHWHWVWYDCDGSSRMVS